MSEKWATSIETDKYFQWHPNSGVETFEPLSPSKQKKFDGLSVSALGAGTYLGPADDATDKLYEKTLLQAGLSGINFFDTAIHYRGMRSERVLSKVIKELSTRGVQRDQIVIASKGGFFPCEGPIEGLEDFIRAQYLDKGIIEAKEIVAGCHCISPAFLDNQIHTSLKNLKLECLDLYYLHNPETQLAEIQEEEFYRRLTDAFRLLEQKVTEKKLRRYGLSTWNGFRQKRGPLQLSKVLACAIEAGGEQNHFKAIQLPFNLVMLEAIHLKNQLPSKKTLASLAQEKGIFLMASSPLMQSQVGQLCRRVFEELPKEESRMAQSLQFVLSTPSICTAFCGMKKGEHWEENKGLLVEPNWTKEVWIKACKSLGVTPE